jgi:MOSC domain-containing protein
MFGRDVRRLRPNLLIGSVDSAAERDWQGATLKMRDATVRLADLRGRCVMTTYHPDTIEQDPGVLRAIVRQFGGKLCLNARVGRPGTVNEGDTAELLIP